MNWRILTKCASNLQSQSNNREAREYPWLFWHKLSVFLTQSLYDYNATAEHGVDI